MIAGAVMQTVAQTGMHILSKTLTDRYLRAANLRLFKPRGLSVRLCTTSAMQHLVAHSGSGAGPSTLDKIGRGVGTVLLQVPIPIPFKSRIIRSIADHAAKVPANISGVGDGKKIPLSTQRRLAALAGQTLPLEFDVPPPAKVQGVMDTMGDWGVKFDAWRTGRKEAKAERRRIALARIEEQLHHTPYGLGYFGRDHYLVGRRERMDLRKAARMERKRNLGRDGLLSPLIGPRETKLERRVRNADLLEHWATDKVLWLVIMNSDQDKDIDGIEKAESLDDEERVDDKTWHTELAKEKDLLEEEAEEDEMDVQDDQKK
ncbi:hypothetical protein C8J57DRAFT_1278953 [Mycena rebaudengoi]|nr:hypothetical protein C8J57DRAFT_1278953 [Mycena rebaudengoi]